MDKMTIATLFLWCGCTFASIAYESNLYMDTVLNAFLPNAGKNNNVDPAKLSNFSSEHKDKVLGITVTVKMDYYNGSMTGFFKVKRSDDCSPIRRDYGNVTLNCNLVFKDIKVRYKAKMKYGIMPNTVVTAEGKMPLSSLFVEVTTSQSRNYPYLRSFHLSQAGHIKENITGLGPLNKSLTKLVNRSFVDHVTIEFLNVLYQNFMPSLQQAVEGAQMPSL